MCKKINLCAQDDNSFPQEKHSCNFFEGLPMTLKNLLQPLGATAENEEAALLFNIISHQAINPATIKLS